MSTYSPFFGKKFHSFVTYAEPRGIVFRIFIVHVDSATQFKEWYYVVDLENKVDHASFSDDKSTDSIIEVIEKNEVGSISDDKSTDSIIEVIGKNEVGSFSDDQY
ncbi:hypothetical protein DITRI_Ditri08aG0034700 [Diplodiscus trichospermus]